MLIIKRERDVKRPKTLITEVKSFVTKLDNHKLKNKILVYKIGRIKQDVLNEITVVHTYIYFTGDLI